MIFTQTIQILYACANGADPDQTAPKKQFDLGLHCLPFSYCSMF